MWGMNSLIREGCKGSNRNKFKEFVLMWKRLRRKIPLILIEIRIEIIFSLIILLSTF